MRGTESKELRKPLRARQQPNRNSLCSGANLSYSSGPDLGYVRGGLNQINVGPDASCTFCPIRGDLDNDGTVDIFDILQLVAHYNQEDLEYNLVGDPVVDIFDVVTAATNYGTTYTPPPP